MDGSSSIKQSYWDRDTTGQSDGLGGWSGDSPPTYQATALTTADAHKMTSYAGWDFTSVWYQAGDLRPILRSSAGPVVDGVIQISNPMQLQLMGANLAGSYALTRDLDASVADGSNTAGVWGPGGFVPVGIGSGLGSFSGTFDGGGHVISGLTINRPSEGDIGLFGETDNATLRNVGLDGASLTGLTSVGGLVGLMSGGSLTQSWVRGSVTGNASGWNVGGLVGYLLGGSIDQSWADGSVTANGGSVRIGGLVGYNISGSIDRSWASGPVTANSGSDRVGGLVGEQFNGTITQSWAAGSVTANSGSLYVGGLVGYQPIGTLSQSYWDTDTTTRTQAVGNVPNASGATGLTTAQFQDTAGFMADASANGWDFANVWAPPSQNYYPTLYALERVVAVDPTHSRPYGEASTVAHYYGLRPGEFLRTAATLTGLPADNANVDDYAVTASGGATTTTPEAYRFVYVPGTVTVTPRPITVTADGGQGKVYGDADPALTYGLTAGDLVLGQDFAGALDRADGETVAGGPYAIGQGSLHVDDGNDGNNYAITYVGADFAITPRQTTVTALGGASTYGGSPADPGLTAGNLAPDEDVGVLSGLTNSFGIGPATSAGTYTLTVAGTLSNSNYEVTGTTSDIWTVTPASLTITANDATKTYGDTKSFAGTEFTTIGLQNGESVGSVTLASPGAAASAGVAGSPYAITASAATGGSFDAANYTISYANGALTVAPRAITVTALGGASAFGGSPADPGLSATNLAPGEDVGVLSGLTNSFGIGPATSAGTYTLSVAGALSNPNYRVTGTNSGTWVVKPASLTITANAASKVYGDADPALTYAASGWQNGDTALLLTGGLARAAGENVGAYAIGQGNLAANGNYMIAYTGADLSITPAALTVTASDGSMVYGDPVPGLAYTVSGWKNSQTDALLGGVMVTTDATSVSNVGSFYATTASGGTLSGAAAGNYTIAYVEGAFAVRPRSITVSADDLDRVYGEADPALTFTVGGQGLVNGDTLSGALATAAGPTANVGAYAIMQGTLAASANYAMTFDGGTLSVRPRAVTVTADDQWRLLDRPDPALTWTITGGSLASFDTARDVFSGSLSRAPGEAVGAYAVGQGSLFADANYVLDFVPGTFTIEPVRYTGAETLERQREAAPVLLLSAAEGVLCSDGILGPDCVAYVNPANRTLGPNIDVAH